MIYFANTYLNFDLNFFYKKHLEFKKKEKNLIMTTSLLHDTPRTFNNVYACHGREILHFETLTRKGNIDLDIWPLLENYKSIDFMTHLSKSRIFIVSSEMFSLFTEYFDSKTIEDVVNSLYLLNPYGFKMYHLPAEEIPLFQKKKKIHESFSIESISLRTSVSFTSQMITRVTEEKKMLKEEHIDTRLVNLTIKYGKCITSIQDYFDINKDFREYQESPCQSHQYRTINGVFNECADQKSYVEGMSMFEISGHSILGKSEYKRNSSINACNVSHGCVVDAKIQNCILWDDVCVNENLKECLVISNGKNGIIYLNKLEEEEDTDSKSTEEMENTFSQTFLTI